MCVGPCVDHQSNTKPNYKTSDRGRPIEITSHPASPARRVRGSWLPHLPSPIFPHCPSAPRTSLSVVMGVAAMGLNICPGLSAGRTRNIATPSRHLSMRPPVGITPAIHPPFNATFGDQAEASKRAVKKVGIFLEAHYSFSFSATARMALSTITAPSDIPARRASFSPSSQRLPHSSAR